LQGESAPSAQLDKREALQNLYRQLLASGRPVQIRTFHSWFAALLARPRWRCCSSKGLPATLSCWKTMPRPCAEVWRPFQARRGR
jgi:ATP-dependent helicase/nuclease subunit A